jgi:hypothetical protein
MEQKNLPTINLSRKQLKDVEAFCKLNEIENIEEFLVNCFIDGYEIEKYGLLSNTGGKDKKRVETPSENKKRVETPLERNLIEYVEVEKEIIKEVIVEKIVEKPIEVIKEVFVEKIVVHTEYVTDNIKVQELVDEIQLLKNRPPTIQVVEKEVVKEIQVEVPVEIIKEIPTVVKKTTVDLSKQKALEETIQKLRVELQLKNKEIQDLNDVIKKTLGSAESVRGVYLDGSNLNRTINRR